MKVRPFLAGALLLAVPSVALVSGCGGGGSGSPFPTPTATALATPTGLPTNTPLPTVAPDASLIVTSESTDGSSFGPPSFRSDKGVIAQTSSRYVVLYPDINDDNRRIRIEFPDTSKLTANAVGSAFDLPTLQATVAGILIEPGTSALTNWGSGGHSQGRLRLVGVSGNRRTLKLEDVVLTRRSESSGPAQGTNQLKLSGTFNIYIDPTQ